MITGNINSTSFSVYPYGEIVIGVPVYLGYYVRWIPDNISGSVLKCSSNHICFNVADLSSYSSGYYTFPSSTSEYWFKSCTWYSVETNYPLVTYAGFNQCYSMFEISLPDCRIIEDYAFGSCVNLQDLSLPYCSSIGEVCFGSCTQIYGITLGYSSVCTLSYWSALGPSGELSNVNYVYVPSSLVSSYKTAPVWSDICTRSGYTYPPVKIYPICTSSYYIQMANYVTGASFVFGNSTYYCSNYSSSYFTSFDGVIPSSAFTDCSFGNGFISTNATAIEYDAFFGCGLSKITLTSCTRIGEEAFGWCSSLYNAYLPKVEFISSSAFAYCASLSGAYLPKCRIIGEEAFMFCGSLSYLIAPECISISSGAFYDCERLEEVYLPVCKTIGPDAFKYTRPVTLSVSNCESIGSNAFYGCLIQRAYLNKCTYIGDYAFRSCRGIYHFYMNSTSVCVLGSDVFTDATFASNYGLFHCGSLANQYKVAPGWSSLSSRIVS